MKKIFSITIFILSGLLSLIGIELSSVDVSLGAGRVFYGNPSKYTNPNIYHVGLSVPVQRGAWLTRLGVIGWNYPNVMYEESAVSSQYYVKDSYFVYYNEIFLTEGLEINLFKNSMFIELGLSGIFPFTNSTDSAATDIISWYYENPTRIINIKSLIHYKLPLSDFINMTGGINITYPLSAFSENDVYDRLVFSLFISSQMKIFN